METMTMFFIESCSIGFGDSTEREQRISNTIYFLITKDG